VLCNKLGAFGVPVVTGRATSEDTAATRATRNRRRTIAVSSGSGARSRDLTIMSRAL